MDNHYNGITDCPKQEMLDTKDHAKSAENKRTKDLQSQQKKIHKCPHEGCVASFNRPYRLEQHILLHFNYRPFICMENSCKKSYSSKSHLDRHVNSVHLGMKRDVDVFSCPSCFKIYSNNQNLKRHMKSHILKMDLTCDVCYMEFRNTNQLRTHRYQHSGVKPFICEICSEEFMTHCEKERHLRYHKMYKCEYCGILINHWNKFREHRKIEHIKKVGDYICNECGKLFRRRCDILRHLKTHSRPPNNKIYLCPHANCDRVYTTNSNLKQHISVKHMQIYHVCTQCNAQLSTKAKLNYHLKLHERITTGTNISKKKTDESDVKLEADVNEIAHQEENITTDIQFIEIKIEPLDLLEPCSPDSIKSEET